MPVAAAGAPSARPVFRDERILAAGTTLRFLLLLFLFVAETYSITDDLTTALVDGSRNDGVGCLLAAGGNPDLGLAVGNVPMMGDSAAFGACFNRYFSGTFLVAPIVTAALVLAAGVLYFLLPIWKGRQSRYFPLARFDTGGDLQCVVADLAARSKLQIKFTIDDCYVDLGAASVSAVVFGTRRHPRIRLNLGLLRIRESDPVRFDAVMLHELAHVANRDVGITYATLAMWRVFLIAVLLPGAVGELIAVFTDHTPVAWGETTMHKSGLLLEVVIALLAYLTRADILRTREIYADRTAQSNSAMLDRSGPTEATAGLSPGRRAATSFAQLWRTHPSWTVRYAALRDPSILFRPRFSALFIAAFAADCATRAVLPQASRWDGSAQALIAALVVGVVGTAVWRAVAAAAASRTAMPSGWLIGVWPGLGLAAAELLRNADEGGRWVPEHPEAVLVLVAATAALTAWTTQYAELRIRAFPRANLRHAMILGLVAPGLALAAILAWWDSAFLIHGWLFDNGQLLAALKLPPHPSWHVAPLPFITVMPGLEMAFRYFTWGLPLLWLIPLALWSRPLPAEPAPWLAHAASASPGSELADIHRPRLLRPVGIGVLGGVSVCGALMATRWYLNPVRAHGSYVVLATETVWIILVLVAAMAVTSAFAAAMARGEYPLVQGLLAAGVTSVLGLVVVWLQNAADGCLGPFDTGNIRQCRFDAISPAQTFSPTIGYVLGSGLLIALLAAAVAQAVTSRQRTTVPATPAERRKAPHPGGRRAAIATAALVAIGPLIADTVYESDRPADSASEASVAALFAAQPAPSPRTQILQANAWAKYAGIDLTNLYIRAYQAFDDANRGLANATDANTQAVWDRTVPPACVAVYEADRKSHTYFPLPVAAGQALWAKAVGRMDFAAAACRAIQKSPGDVPFFAAYDDLFDAVTDMYDTDNWITSLTSARQPEAMPQQKGLLGEAQTATADGNLSYRFTVSHYAVRPDRTATIQVETCLDQGPPSARVGVSWAPWYIVLADGTKATPLKQPSQNYPGSPLYPDGNNKPLTVGECVRGQMIFNIPAGATNQAVEVDRSDPYLSWHVPQPGS